MKCKMTTSFGAYHSGPDFKLNLKSLMSGFQDVVALHAETSGCGIHWLLSREKAWVMHRMVIHFFHRPETGRNLNFVTWHKGEKGYRAYRDYEVWCGSEKQVSAASLWLFIDLEKNKLIKVPKESRQWYGIDNENALNVDIDAFKPVKEIEHHTTESITIRSSDIDPIGHVNNAVYLDLLETAVDRYFSGGHRIEKVMIQFHKEITKDVTDIRVGISEDENTFRFDLASPAGIHAFGDFTVETKD